MMSIASPWPRLRSLVAVCEITRLRIRDPMAECGGATSDFTVAAKGGNVEVL